MLKPTRDQNLYIIFFLNTIYPLSKGLKDYLSANIRHCKFKKNEIILQTGKECDKLFLIKKGLVRGFMSLDDTDITIWIDSENEIFTSVSGFFRQKMSKETIQCLEDTYCDYLTYEDYQYCLNHFPEMNHISRILLEEYYALAEYRVYLTRIPNAEKRLEYFTQNSNSNIINRIPKKYLASFLAMRPETLSRLLKN